MMDESGARIMIIGLALLVAACVIPLALVRFESVIVGVASFLGVVAGTIVLLRGVVMFKSNN